MAHMIDETTGRPAIAYAGDTPWHKLGRKMGETERRDFQAAMQLAGLNWQVETVPLRYSTYSPSGITTGQLSGADVISTKTVSDAKGIIRLDTGAYLGTVGSGYTPIQNAQGFDVLAPLVENHKCTIEVMASLDGGRRSFALVRLPDTTVTPATGDDVRGYICIVNAHDGTSALRAILTPIRVVCQNTLSAAQQGSHTTACSIKHTKSAPDRLKQAAEIVERMQLAMQKTGDTYKSLAARSMNPKQLAEYIETVIPAAKDLNGEIPEVIRKRRETIADLIFHGHHSQADGGADAGKGYASAWRAYNAVTEYFDHQRPREAKSQSARMTAYDSAIFGASAAIKAKALQVLVAA